MPDTITNDLDEHFRSQDSATLDLDETALEPVMRDVDGAQKHIDVAQFSELMSDAVERFGAQKKLPASSDAWLSPRVHASLRLTRQEASDPRIWTYLAIAVAPTYVRHRWGDPKTQEAASLDRFVNRDRKKQAIARLWWTAEMFRNGPDYRPVVDAFAMQDIPNGFVTYDCFENRPLAIGIVKELIGLNAGRKATSRQVKKVGRTINLWLSTTSLDAVAPDENTDPARTWSWVTVPVQPPISDVELPIGPDDGEVNEKSLDAARALSRAVIGLGIPAEESENDDE
jgi:hypothetical protein